jgi:glutamine synthetase type III
MEVRNTFEAEVIPHGIQHLLHSFGTTLHYYSTVFISYLEKHCNKIPLLRALSAIDEAATDVVNILIKMLRRLQLHWVGSKNIF